MKGIHYVVGDSGQRRAVHSDRDDWGDRWEERYDVLVARSRRDEPTVDWHHSKDGLD